MGDLEDELARADGERYAIIERYKLGRSELNKINQWEDPDFVGQVHKTDRYGFIHTNTLPTSFDENEKKEKEIENQRAQKWLKMLKNFEKFSTVQREKLKRRIYKGIPDKLRGAFWQKLLKVEESQKANPDVYIRMLKLAYKYSTDIRQIDNDINRCFRDHEYFCERYSTKQQQLFNVLVAYSVYNSELGYCQGMSSVAAVLLMYLGEEETFWALNSFMIEKKFAMHGLYIVGFPKLMRFLNHHDKILTKFLPKLKKHFDKHNLDSVLYSLKWFFVIFVERIPFSLCLRVWDIFLLEGERVVTAMAYTILKLHSTRLLKFKDMDAITDFLQYKLFKNFGYSDNYVIKSLETSLTDLRTKRMHLPQPATDESELPKCELGQFIEPTIEKKLGLRTACFTDCEKNVTDYVISRNEENGNDVDILDENNADDTISNLNTVTNLSDFEGDLSFMDDDVDDVDEITFTNSNQQNRKSLTGTSITSISEDRRSISTLNQQNFDEIIKDEEGIFHFNDQHLIIRVGGN